MKIRLCCLHQEEWRCPSQIQNWLLCFPRPLRASDCTGGLRLLPNAQGWTIGSWGRRPIVRQSPPVSFFPEVHKVVTRSWRAPFLPRPSEPSLETGLVPPPSSPPSTVGWPKGMWRSPQSSVLLPCSSARKAQLPGGVIHAFCPGPASSRFDISCPGGPLLSPPHRRLQLLHLLVAEGRPPAVSTSAPARPQIQFTWHPPNKFRGVQFTSVLNKVAPVLRAEVAVLLAKEDRAGPSSQDEIRVLQPLLHRTQERRWVTTNLGPARSEQGPSQASIQDVDTETHLSMHPSFRLVCSNRLKDIYIHVSNLHRHRPFLRFAFEERAYQYKALRFGLSLSPRDFTKVVEAALVPLREASIRILNYLDDWLILAQTRVLLCEHRDTVLSHLSRLGLQVNWEKSKLSPTQTISLF